MLPVPSQPVKKGYHFVKMRKNNFVKFLRYAYLF